MDILRGHSGTTNRVVVEIMHHLHIWLFFFQECVLFEDGSSCRVNPECPSEDNECTSGESVCQPLYSCANPGQCEGGIVVSTFRGDENNDVSEDDCLQACKDHHDENLSVDEGGTCSGDDCQSPCNWYTYDNSTQQCLMFDLCPEIDFPDCNTCSSGERLCELSNPGW